jgi:hypothetical protein
MKQNRFIYLFSGAVALLLITLALVCNGTGDSGDSVLHYLYARYAYSNTANFFNSWAKPLYVLLGAPFAQLGFTGIKIFNIINTTLSMVCTYLIAKRLQLDNNWLIPVLLILAPLHFALSLSGLTEPLFACLLISGLCLLFYERTIAGLIILSFLPFARSEGMFLLIIIALYLVRQKKYSSILFLSAGQIIYALAGYFHSGSLIWFYQTNPYSVISKYGSGALNTYFINMPLIIGPASCVLLAAGFLSVPIKALQTKNKDAAQILLIWSLFTAYFFFHVISWTLGLFSSLGLPRIIDGVCPLMIILCLYGFNQIITLTVKPSGRATVCNYAAALVIIINFAYILVKYNGHIGTAGFDLLPSTDELVENKMADYIKQKFPDYKKRKIIYTAPYLSIPLNIDPTATGSEGSTASNVLYIWDDWYSVVEGKTTFDMLKKDNDLVYDTTFNMYEKTGKEKTVALFRTKSSVLKKVVF